MSLTAVVDPNAATVTADPPTLAMATHAVSPRTSATTTDGVHADASAFHLAEEKPQIVTTGTPPYCIVNANNLWLRACGYRRKEIIGQTPKILQGPLTEKTALETLMGAVKKRETASVTLTNYTKNKQAFRNVVTIEPIVVCDRQMCLATYMMSSLQPIQPGPAQADQSSAAGSLAEGLVCVALANLSRPQAGSSQGTSSASRDASVSEPAASGPPRLDPEGRPILKDNQWKKYGQKITKKRATGPGQTSLRCYYKCNFPGCQAKRQIEKVMENDVVVQIIPVIKGQHCHPESVFRNVVCYDDMDLDGQPPTKKARVQNSSQNGSRAQSGHKDSQISGNPQQQIKAQARGELEPRASGSGSNVASGSGDSDYTDTSLQPREETSAESVGQAAGAPPKDAVKAQDSSTEVTLGSLLQQISHQMAPARGADSQATEGAKQGPAEPSQAGQMAAQQQQLMSQMMSMVGAGAMPNMPSVGGGGAAAPGDSEAERRKLLQSMLLGVQMGMAFWNNSQANNNASLADKANPSAPVNDSSS